MMKILLTLITLSILCVPINAQVYSYKDANGNTIYTDNPPKGQQTRKLDIGSSYSADKQKKEENSNPTLPTVRLTPPPPVEAKPIYSLLRILLPEPDTSVINTGGVVVVSLESEPKLKVGHRYRILLDDNIVETSTKPVVTLKNIERGEHKLAAEIINNEDGIIERTAAQPFYVRQTTLADKRRVNPCKFKEYGTEERPECPIEDKPSPESLMRRLTNTIGITVKCELADYGVKKGCPIEKKPEIDEAEETETSTGS